MHVWMKNRPPVLPAVCGLLHFICLISIFMIGCSLPGQEKKNIVIVVGSRNITADQLKQDLEFIGCGIPIPHDPGGGIRDQLIQKLIDHYLIIEYGKENNISVSEGELAAALNEIKAGYKEDAFEESLLRGCVDFEDWKGRFRERLLVDKIMEKITQGVPYPSYEDIKRYFEENRDQFRCPKMVEFRQIVTRTKEEAQKLLDRLHEGEDMGKLAQLHSVAPEAEEGGRVGWVAMEDLEESMAKALFSLPRGKISPIVTTPYGYHIFEVLSVRPEGLKDISEVMSHIEAILIRQRQAAALKVWLGGLKRHFSVKVDQNLLNRMELS